MDIVRGKIRQKFSWENQSEILFYKEFIISIVFLSFIIDNLAIILCM